MPRICTIAQALPKSLRILEAFRVPREVLLQLTALERLSLDFMLISTGQPTCSLSALQRLTSLDLHYVREDELYAAAGCSGLRTLCLHGE